MKTRRTIALAIGGIIVGAAVTMLVIWWTRWDDRVIAWPSSLPPCDGFELPVPADDERQPFGVNEHLGADYYGAVGTPVHASAAGVVIFARDIGGDWGNVVRIAHGCGVETVSAHLDRIEVAVGGTVQRGARIGTIGTADGNYTPHLHFELRDRPMKLGGGYDADATGYLDPTAYIAAHPVTGRSPSSP